MVLGISSLVASFLALGVSIWTALRQVRIMRHSNQVPLLVETFKEYRSPLYQRYEHYVVNNLAKDHSPELGFAGLPEEARTAATSLVTFFNVLGSFLIFGMADESVIVPLFAYRASQAWDALEPYIRRERQARGNYYFASHFEDLVCRTRDHPAADFGLRLRRVHSDGGPCDRTKIRHKPPSAPPRRPTR